MADESLGCQDFIWNIKFSSDIIRTGEAIVGETSVSRVLDNTKWFLSVYPRGKENSEFVDIFITRCSEDDGADKIPIKITFHLVTAEWRLHERRESPKWIFERGSTWGIERYIERKTLLEDMKSTLWPDDVLTIHCRMQRAPSDIGYLAQSITEEYPETVEKEVPWTIDNWRAMSEVEKDVEFSGEHKGKFRMIICGSKNSDKELVLELKKIEPESKSVNVSCRIAVLDAEGSEALFKTIIYRFRDKPFDSDTRFLFTRDNIQDIYPKEGALSLRCVLSMETGQTLRKTVTEVVVSHGDLRIRCERSVNEDLVQGFGNLLRSGDCCDVKLKAGGKVVNSRSSILRSWSEAFSDILDRAEVYSEDGVEKRDVVIADLDGETLEQMINFFHTGEVENKNPASVLKLFEAGHKYKVRCLKRKCADYLRRAFTFQNVYDILKAADVYEDVDLERHAIEYICEYWSRICLTDEWENFMETEKELGRYVCKEIRRIKCI